MVLPMGALVWYRAQRVEGMGPAVPCLVSTQGGRQDWYNSTQNGIMVATWGLWNRAKRVWSIFRAWMSLVDLRGSREGVQWSRVWS